MGYPPEEIQGELVDEEDPDGEYEEDYEDED